MDTCNFSSSKRTRRTFAITSIRVIPSPPRFASYEFFLRTKIIPPPRSWLRSGEMKRETFLHDPEKHWPPLSFLARGKRKARCSRGTWLDRRLLDLEFLCVVSFIGSVCSFTGLNWKLGSGRGWEAGEFLLRIIDPL